MQLVDANCCASKCTFYFWGVYRRALRWRYLLCRTRSCWPPTTTHSTKAIRIMPSIYVQMDEVSDDILASCLEKLGCAGPVRIINGAKVRVNGWHFHIKGWMTPMKLASWRHVKMDDILAFVYLIDDSCCTWSLCNFASWLCSDYHWMMDGLSKVSTYSIHWLFTSLNK